MIPEYRKDMDVDKITEYINTRNVLSVIDYSKETRVMVNTSTERMDWMVKEIMTLRAEVQNLTGQVGFLRGELLGGGPTA